MTRTVDDGDRRAEVTTVLNEITDPCSRGANLPIGMVDMGLVEHLEVANGHVRLRLIPTYPGCLFIGFFEVEARTRLRKLTWCEDVSVEQVSAAEGVWTEDRMSPAARARLEDRRARLRRASVTEPSRSPARARPGTSPDPPLSGR